MNPSSITRSGLRTAPSTTPSTRNAEPRYALGPLLDRSGRSWEELGQHVGRSRATMHRRLRNGISWGEADDFAIACGFFPWEIWPEWDTADPSTWCDLPADEADDTVEVAA